MSASSEVQQVDILLTALGLAIDKPYRVALLNCCIMTAPYSDDVLMDTISDRGKAAYVNTPLLAEEAALLLKHAQGYESFIAHAGCAKLAADLFFPDQEAEAGFAPLLAPNTKEYRQSRASTGELAIAIQLRKRLPFGVQLTLEQMKEIGYTISAIVLNPLNI